METFAAFIVKDSMLLLYILLMGERYSDQPLAPWLLGSDQNEKLNSELRAFVLTRTEWSFKDLIALVRRWHYQSSLLSDPEVELPPVFSAKGYSRDHYSAEDSARFVYPQSDYPTEGELLTMYDEVVEELRPIFVALGMAEALHAAGRWDAPTLEVWSQVEAAMEEEEAAAAAAAEEEQFEEQARRARAARAETAEGDGDDSDDDDDDDDDDGPAVEAPLPPPPPREWVVGKIYDVESLVAARTLRGGVGEREFLVKWEGWGANEQTWERQSALLLDVPEMVKAYCSAKGLRLEALDDDEEEGEQEAPAEEETATAGGAAPPRAPSTVPAPPNLSAADREALLDRLTACIGSERLNTHVRAVRPSAEASAAQRAHHTRTHLWNPESQQEEHKATIVARGQQQQMDAKPGAGRTRYRVGVRMAIISEDAARTGFEYDGVYQMHVPSEGGASCVLRAKNGAVLPLDGTMEVTLVRIIELRKSVGKAAMHPRLSVRRGDAHACTAVVLPFLAVEAADGTRHYEANRRVAPPQRVPLACLGERVKLCEVSEEQGEGRQRYVLASRCPGVGGEPLRRIHLDASAFAAGVMHTAPIDLEAMKGKQLSAELEARGAAKTGRKGALQQRLHALLVLAQIERWRTDGDEAMGEAEGDEGDEAMGAAEDAEEGAVEGAEQGTEEGAAEGAEEEGEADAADGDESDGESPPPPARVVSAVTKHKVYSGAKPGSLDNVWFGIKYTDGSATGRRGEVEAPTPLMATAEGRAALKAYVQTRKGRSAVKYVPLDW